MKENKLHKNKKGFIVPKDYFDNFEVKLTEKNFQKDDTEVYLRSDRISSGLKIPDNYFNTFENQLIEKLNIQEIKPCILANNLKTGLTIPDKYFENLQESILQKTHTVSKENKVVPLFSGKNILYVSSIAAMIVIIIAISINKEKDSFSIDSIDIADIQEYFEEGNAEFSDVEIAELLNYESNISAPFGTTELSDQELEDYLSDEEFANEILYIE